MKGNTLEFYELDIEGSIPAVNIISNFTIGKKVRNELVCETDNNTELQGHLKGKQVTEITTKSAGIIVMSSQ